MFLYIRERIGYDGTIHTPSFQLLKPTACSLGHRVPIKAKPMHTASSPNALRRDHFTRDMQEGDPKHHGVSQNIPRFDNSEGMGVHVTTKVFACHDSPATAALDPFGRLNRSNHSESTASDDEDMDQTSPSILADFDLDVDPSTPEMKYYIPSEKGASQPTQKFLAPPSPLQRCSSWSPGANTFHRSSSYSEGGRDRNAVSADRRRSCNIDPVASQLLRACSVHDDEEDEVEQVSIPLSKSCNGKIPANWSNPMPSNFFSASMPDLQIPHRGRNKVAPMIAEGVPINYPLSPIMREVSDSLLDVKTEEDIKCLPRPVPRKPASHNRRSSLPFSFQSSPSLSSSLPGHL